MRSERSSGFASEKYCHRRKWLTWKVDNYFNIYIRPGLLTSIKQLLRLISLRKQIPASAGSPRWILDPRHYLRLTRIDDQSMTNIMKDLDTFDRGSLTKDNVHQLTPWFQKLATFFLLYRPSNGRTTMSDLLPDERNRFWASFTLGPGRMFHAHVTLIAIKTINWGKKVDPNDLYDAIQLLLLTDGRLFISNEKNFLRHTKDSYVKRVLPWEAFKKLPA